jgi:hypothetical protein
MTPEEAKKIKSLRIENQLIDDEISRKTEVFAGDPDQVYFVDCSFNGDGRGILRECPSASKIGLIRCNLSYEILEKLLYSNNPYNNFDVLDLTGNELSKEPEKFVEVLRKAIVIFKLIKELILVDNGFDESIIFMIKEVARKTIRKITI